MLGKNLGNLEEQGNENLLTFSEVKHSQCCPGDTAWAGTDSSGSSAERTGTWGTAGLSKVLTLPVLGCSGVFRSDTSLSTCEVAASPAESQWGAQESAAHGVPAEL